MKKAQLFTDLGKWVLIVALLLILLIFILNITTEISILEGSLFGRGF